MGILGTRLLTSAWDACFWGQDPQICFVYNMNGRAREAWIVPGWNPVAIITTWKCDALFSNLCNKPNDIYFVFIYSHRRQPDNATFTGSHPNFYTFIFVLLMHASRVIVSVKRMPCVILWKIKLLLSLNAITFSFIIFKGNAVEICKLMSNLISHEIKDVIP